MAVASFICVQKAPKAFLQKLHKVYNDTSYIVCRTQLTNADQRITQSELKMCTNRRKVVLLVGI